MLGIVVGSLTGLVILYLVVVLFGPGFDVPRQPLPTVDAVAREGKGLPPAREEVRLSVEGLSVSAWLYLPKALARPAPCIIMNHGFGGTKDMLLEPYALRFQKAGLAVLTYDYRYFGESEGEPRQLFAIPYQLKDCLGALDYVRNREEIDPGRVAFWGTSAGGGYGLAIAAQDKRIACVCAQVAGLDSDEDGRVALAREGWGFFLRLFVHAQRDKGRSRFGLSAHRIPIVGKPGSLAMITAPGAFEGYARIASPGFVNEVCARALLMTQGFNPMDYVADVRCPVLLQICDKDNLVSSSSAIKAAERLGEYAEVERYPIGHFDIYFDEHFEQAAADQIAFFTKHLITVDPVV
jgi:fermentation-respiration switch protein FrsA (DUF1100 family)